MLVITACAMYAYYVNSKRPDNDPKKKNYHPLAILLAPITFPLLIIFSVSIFILRVVTYGVFMVLFIFALIVIRKPFILEWLKKKATAIGDRLLEANTLLIRIFLRPWASSGESS
ncbi:MAG TPA: hypothetical protein VI524_09685 [Anaerolineales bacterium]|nr:hypothetical protein [Anaerolineales bacterium]